MVRQLIPTASNIFGDANLHHQQASGSGYRHGDEQHPSTLISRLAKSSSVGAPSGQMPLRGGGLLPLGVLGGGSSSTQSSIIYIPSHPAGVCLEAVLAMFLSDDICSVIARGDEGKEALPTVLTSVILTCASMLSEAMLVESNIRLRRIHGLSFGYSLFYSGSSKPMQRDRNF